MNWDRYAAWREAYKPKKRILNRLWTATVSTEQKMIWSAKKRAKNKNLEFTITVEDIKIPNLCPLLNISLHKNNKTAYNSPSLDRKDSTKGYTKDNIWVISHKANSVKNNLTIDELELLVKNLREAAVDQHCSNRRQEGTDDGVGEPTSHSRCNSDSQANYVEAYLDASASRFGEYPSIEELGPRYS